METFSDDPRHPLIAEIVGWAGAVVLLGAYGLLSSGYLPKPNALYHLANAVGAAGLMVNAAAHRSWPPVLVNVVWAAIAIAALLFNV